MAAGERWNPWRALRERAATTLFFDRMASRSGYCEIDEDGAEVVVLDPRLDRVGRNAVLGHELVHLERGILPSGTPPAILAREEHQVREETSRRLVPLEQLAEYVARCDDGVTPEMVAEEFEVPAAVAERALAQLRHPRSAAIRMKWNIEGAA